MANTFTKIATVTVGSGGASSIDFNSIPQTYTDLCLKTSLRSPRTANWTDYPLLSVNSSTANQSVIWFNGNGAAASSGTDTIFEWICGSTGSGGTQWTANSFSNDEIYIPNYSSGTNKSMMGRFAVEQSNATAYLSMHSWLRSSTAAITSLSITNQYGLNWVQYSTATLYGVKNS